MPQQGPKLTPRLPPPTVESQNGYAVRWASGRSPFVGALPILLWHIRQYPFSSAPPRSRPRGSVSLQSMEFPPRNVPRPCQHLPAGTGKQCRRPCMVASTFASERYTVPAERGTHARLRCYTLQTRVVGHYACKRTFIAVVVPYVPAGRPMDMPGVSALYPYYQAVALLATGRETK